MLSEAEINCLFHDDFLFPFYYYEIRAERRGKPAFNSHTNARIWVYNGNFTEKYDDFFSVVFSERLHFISYSYLPSYLILNLLNCEKRRYAYKEWYWYAWISLWYDDGITIPTSPKMEITECEWMHSLSPLFSVLWIGSYCYYSFFIYGKDKEYVREKKSWSSFRRMLFSDPFCMNVW